MWWEYLIIAGGLLGAATYVLWTVVRNFRAKGNCCGSSCGHAPDAAESMALRHRPLVELKRSSKPDNMTVRD
jgi:hypothetical protein